MKEFGWVRNKLPGYKLTENKSLTITMENLRIEYKLKNTEVISCGKK